MRLLNRTNSLKSSLYVKGAVEEHLEDLDKFKEE